MPKTSRAPLNLDGLSPKEFRYILRALHLKHQRIEEKIGELMSQRVDVEEEIAEAQKANGIRL